MKTQANYVKFLLQSFLCIFLSFFLFSNQLLAQRNNIVFQSLGSEADAITKWATVGTATSYGIPKATAGSK